MKGKADLGTTRVVKLGEYTVGFRIPAEWCSHNNVGIGDTLYVEGHLDGAVTIHAKEAPWTKPVLLRLKDRKYPIVTLPKDITRTRGITSGDTLHMVVDLKSGALELRRDR